MYDEPDDEQPMPEPNREPIKIAVETEISFGEVIDRIACRALGKFKRDYYSDDPAPFNRVIEQTIVKAVEARAAALVDQRVEAEVARLLTDGWTEQGSYGEPKSALTLESLVRRHLTAKQRAPRYDSPERTAIELKVDTFIAENVARAMDEELKAARERFRKAVDALIEQKVLEAARAALTGGR